jgi:acetyl-CoA carboxylase biotin carboxylase subunit
MRKRRVLIANRGEIALRIIRACVENDIETVLVVSEADRDSLPARLADRVVCIGPPQANKSYLDIPSIVTAAMGTQADAIHPGYGFLAENVELPEACEKFGIIFVGPRSETMRQLGDKITARTIAAQCSVPVVEGSEGIRSLEDAEAKAQEIGFPVLLKASAGGGGRGMRIVMERKDLKNAFDMASNEAQTAFGDSTLFVERYIQNGRHVEVQILGDGFGNIIHLGKRDCSSQRHYQKVIEEAPPPGLSDDLRKNVLEAAVKLAEAVAYNNAGTVEFLVDKDRNQFYFMEVNSRIQVEHPVTEMITGVDLVREQLRIAFGDFLPMTQAEVQCKGHAIECRVTAENPKDDFMPSPGRITRFVVPDGSNIRVDTHCYEGYLVTPYYDSLMAKVVATGDTRDSALENLRSALSTFSISGVETNIPFLQFLIDQPQFITGDVNIKWIEDVMPRFLETQEGGKKR